jgi:hypothetical protein
MARYSGRNLYLSYDGTVIDTVRSVTWSDEADDTTSNVFDALVPQNEGTAIWGPDGTASGNKRFTAAAVVTSREQEAPYDDVVTIASTVRLNVLPTADTWP